MAICRCRIHSHTRNQRGNAYIYFVKPLGYPNTSSICGSPGCSLPGAIFLNVAELEVFQANPQRIISFASVVTKVKAEEFIYHEDSINQELI